MSADFTAAASALGYLFQFRCALLLLLLLERGEDTAIRLECLDDIVVQEATGTSLHQLKLHQQGVGDLSDSSVDLWKTLRIWSTLTASGQIIQSGTAFVLVKMLVTESPQGAVHKPDRQLQRSGVPQGRISVVLGAWRSARTAAMEVHQ